MSKPKYDHKCPHFEFGKYKFDPSKLTEAHGFCLRAFMRAIDTSGRAGGTAPEYVIVDNTNTTILEMAPYVAIAQAYSLPIRIVSFRCPLDVAAKRNVHNVPTYTVERQQRNIDMMNDFPRHWKFTYWKIDEQGTLLHSTHEPRY